MRPAYDDPELLEKTLFLSNKFKVDTFFETGTYDGSTVNIIANYFDNVISVEINEDCYNKAKSNVIHKNCKLHLGNSIEIMNDILIEEKSNIFFFLDAHLYQELPLLDELNVIYNKRLKPIIAIHDFFVPDENNAAKFYWLEPLDFNYIKSSIELIYGKNGYEIEYSTVSIPSINSGTIFIFPKMQ
jgi:hypothetical protein